MADRADDAARRSAHAVDPGVAGRRPVHCVDAVPGGGAGEPVPVTPAHGDRTRRPTAPGRRLRDPDRLGPGPGRRGDGAGHRRPTTPPPERRGRPDPCRCSAACRSRRSPSGAGLRRIDVLAWRDFDDPEAGGSELHAHRVITAWSEAGLDVSMTTSSVPGGRRVVRRDGYRVIRRAGRYSVFPRSILSGAVGRIGTGDGVVEIWNGMPFFSPVWSRSPQITFLHHVHDEMWKLVLPRGLAEAGHLLEHRIAPPFYRNGAGSSPCRTPRRPRSWSGSTCRPTASRSSRPGVEPRFTPGGERSAGAAGGGRRSPGAGQAVPSAHRGPGAAQGRTTPTCGPSWPARATSGPPSRP